MDAAEDTNDSDLEREVTELRQENKSLRNRVERLEIERDEMRNALQPVLHMLGIPASGKKSNRNGEQGGRGGNSAVDHLGATLNGHGSAALQDLTMISNGNASMQGQTRQRQVGW